MTAPKETTPLLDAEADSLIHWACARAGVIVIAPVVGTVALIANEVFLVSRLGTLYGYDLDASAARGFLLGLGGAAVGQTLATLVPIAPLQVAIGVSVTYAVGQAAREWFKAGMPPDLSQAREAFTRQKKEAESQLDTLKVHPRQDQPLGDESKRFDR